MNHLKIVPGKTKLRFNYTDRKGNKTVREGTVIELGKGRQYTFVRMDDQLRGKPRSFSVNRMEHVIAVTY